MLPVKTESQRVSNSVYCCKIWKISIDNWNHLALDPSVHCFSFICSAAKQQLVKPFFFFPFYIPGVLPSLDSSCLCLFFTVSTSTTTKSAFLLALCLFLCIICILSPFLMLLIYYSHFLIMLASCILFSSVAEISLYFLVGYLWLLGG